MTTIAINNVRNTRADADEIAVADAALHAAHPREIVRWALDRFAAGRVAVVTGLQAEGMVIVDMALALDAGVRIVTIDTGRLPAETLGFLDTVRAHYRRDVEVLRPRPEQVVDFVAAHGADAFYISPELRADCCELRKVRPLDAVMPGLDCWLTGLRRGQSSLRAGTPAIALDPAHGGAVKVAPLAAWDDVEVDAYLDAHGVPRHPLYAHGYRSIGCAPCTRAVRPGEPARSGRWWWEQGIDSECGIHRHPLASDPGRREVTPTDAAPPAAGQRVTGEGT